MVAKPRSLAGGPRGAEPPSEAPLWRSEKRRLGDLKPWRHNPRQIGKAEAGRLLESFGEYGQVQTVAVGPGNEVYDGHQRLSALLKQNGPDYEVDVRVSSRALTEGERKRLTVLLHRGAFGEWDLPALEGLFEPEELIDCGLDPSELIAQLDLDDLDNDIIQESGEPDSPDEELSEDDWKSLGEDADADLDDDSPEAEPPAEEPLPGVIGAEPLPLPAADIIFPTDNDWGIPLLRVAQQAPVLVLPFEAWGSKAAARTRYMEGCWHFYTDDYRFNALWTNPTPVVRSGCAAVVEPNFSCYEDMPLAVGLYRIYQKRWLARYWQEHGIGIIVDLNVSLPYEGYNLLGVPAGWRSYACHGSSDALDLMDRRLAIARKHAGTDDVLFVVYGGGKYVIEWCRSHGAVWSPEQRDAAKGRFRGEYPPITPQTGGGF